MQDEIKKHSKKAIEVMKNSDHSFVDKIKEIGIEISIIIFAVSFSIWLHTWNEHRHQQEEVKDFLVDLKEDLKNDIENQIDPKNVFLKTVENFNYIINLTEEEYDSLRGGKDSTLFRADLSNKLNSFPNQYFKSRSGNYEGFKSSGKIGYIENKKLKILIIEYYEHVVQGAALQDVYTRETLMKTGEILSDIDGNGKKIVFNKKLRQHLETISVMSSTSSANCDNISKSAKEILDEIDKQTFE
jgi:hypothetical protein